MHTFVELLFTEESKIIVLDEYHVQIHGPGAATDFINSVTESRDCQAGEIGIQ